MMHMHTYTSRTASPRSLLWAVTGLATVVVVLGVAVLGALGLPLVLPALFAIWAAAAVTAE